jgi:hypothetical protein
VAELADALAPFAPRSQPSISRISGILRSASVRTGRTDKSPSSERTLQSPGAPISGDAETEELKVKVITPFVGSEKVTKTDWEASPSSVKRTRRRALVVVGGVAAIVAAIIGWQRRSTPTEAGPDPSVKATLSAPPAVQPAPAPVPAAESAAAEPPAVQPAPSAAAAPAAPSGKPPTAPVVAAKPKPPVKPVAAPAAPAPAPPAAAPKPAADPLDGRR